MTINRVRTLLLNRGREGVAPTALGEEYIAPDVHRRRLSGAVLRGWQFLFGASPDRFFLNFRLRQLLTLIHTSELADWVTADDPRITYWPFDDSLFAVGVAPTVTREAGDTEPPFIFGTSLPDENLGVSSYSWVVTALSSELVRIVDLRRKQTFSAAVSYSSGLSLPVAIPHTSMVMKFRPLTAGDQWAIQLQTRPQIDIGERLAGFALVLGEQAVSEIFRHSRPEFLLIWRRHPHAVTRYAALLLAMADAIELAPVEAT
jgi:hypothetical protein